MCAQCMAAAATAGAAATGTRAWLSTRGYAWLTPVRLRRASAGLIALGVAASGIAIG